MVFLHYNNISRILLFFALIAIPLTGVRAQTLRIMPLGNSITAGSMCTNGDIHSCEPLGGHIAVGYRQRLYNLLNSAGYDFDFVGSETYGNALMSDSDCAGFGGIRDSQLADIMETGTSSHTGFVVGGPYMNYFPADIVLLHVGTNDVLASDTAWTDIPRILDAIDAYEAANNTSVTVFLARIISTRYASCGSDRWVTAYNRLIDQLAASRIAAGDRLILVDMECGAGIDYNNDLADQVHPNQDGYDKMGDAWFAAIEAWTPPTDPTYSLTMETSLGSGTTSPSEGTHNYVQGSTVSVSATAGAGYVFSGWSGSLTGSDNPADVLMDGDKEITATFEKLSYDLSVTTDGTLGAVVNPAGTLSVDHGVQTSISVSSLPEGSSFDGWEVISGSSVTIANPSSMNTTVKLEAGSASIRANFTTVTHRVRIDITGEGSVDKDPNLEDYPVNSTVSLTALPAEGYYFYEWTGNVTGTENPADLVMDGEKGLRATFRKSYYNLTVNTDGTAGTAVSPSGSISVEHGVETSISVSSIPDGSTFYGWEVVSGSSVSIADPSSLSTTVTLASGDATIRANFSPFSHQCTLSVVGLGNVERNPELEEYPNNSELVLTAIPQSGYNFTGWTGDLEGSDNPAEVLMNGDKDITANFEKLRYELTVNTDGTEGALVDPTETITVEHGTETAITVSQVPEGYRFNGWEISSGSSVSIADASATTTTVTLESGPAAVQANFAGITHSLRLQVSGKGSVGKAPDQAEYSYNSIPVLTAIPETGYYFIGWTGDLSGSDNPADVIMNGDKDITANFEKLNYELTLSSDGTEGVLLDPEGTISVEHGVETGISVSQVPQGYQFKEWEVRSGSSVTITDPSSPTTTVILESGSAAIRASFTDNSTVGLAQVLNEAVTVHIYPNPAEDHIYVNHPPHTNIKGRILVTDMKGRQIISLSSADLNSDLRLDISKLSPGIYMVHWLPETGVTHKGKFMKID